MKLRFLAFSFLAGNLWLLSSFAQTAQPPASQALATVQAPSVQSSCPQQTPARTDSQPGAPQEAVQPPASPPQPASTFQPFRVILVPRRKNTLAPGRKYAPKLLPDGPLDPGIFLPRLAGLNGACGSIVSYNFSQGEDPQLESVTTCTPSSAMATLRAKDKEDKPPAPQLQKADY